MISRHKCKIGVKTIDKSSLLIYNMHMIQHHMHLHLDRDKEVNNHDERLYHDDECCQQRS